MAIDRASNNSVELRGSPPSQQHKQRVFRDVVGGDSDSDVAVEEEGEEEEDEEEARANISEPPQRLLPVLKHAATSRETDDAKRERLTALKGGDVTPASPARIRLAPPPCALPPLSPSAACSVPESTTPTSPRDHELAAMEASMVERQQLTARCFRVLDALQQHSTSGNVKALLQQVTTVLLHATYELATTTAGDDNNQVVNAGAGAGAVDLSALEELFGHEFFAQFVRLQRRLDRVRSRRQELETRVAMERSLELELVALRERLERDLHAIRASHGATHERVERERAAVEALEAEHLRLSTLEKALRAECETHEHELERHRLVLQELQAKSHYLDFVSRIPLKRHLEEKKLQEQEDALTALAAQEEAENQRLEGELQRLDEQLRGLEEQQRKDVALLAEREQELVAAEQQRDATRDEMQRMRACHTPRPQWDEIIEQTPELSAQKFEWELLDATVSSFASNAHDVLAQRQREREGSEEDDAGGNEGEEEVEENEEDEDEVEGPRTQQLVKEMLQWIERLQKHCGVNLHLSRVRVLCQALRSCACVHGCYQLSFCLSVDLARRRGSACGAQHPPPPTGSSAAQAESLAVSAVSCCQQRWLVERHGSSSSRGG
ncbi:hypothetical protein PINS_up023577 [Pythium insidiosum]|nr:hypothetical protein PINS_up023577 [Pythium insidiosum]